MSCCARFAWARIHPWGRPEDADGVEDAAGAAAAADDALGANGSFDDLYDDLGYADEYDGAAAVDTRQVGTPDLPGRTRVTDANLLKASVLIDDAKFRRNTEHAMDPDTLRLYRRYHWRCVHPPGEPFWISCLAFGWVEFGVFFLLLICAVLRLTFVPRPRYLLVVCV